MKWLYVVLWGALTAWEIPPRWRDKRKEAVLWLAVAVVGLALGIVCFWLGVDWRLAEWLV